MNNNSDDLTSRLRQSLNARDSAPLLSDDLVSGASSRTAPRIVSRKRSLQFAGAATFAVAAATVGVLVVASPFQQGPLFTASGATGETNALGAAEDSQTDMRMINWIDYHYEAGAGLSNEGGSGHVYQLKRSGSYESVLNAVADTLSVDGNVVKSSYFDATYPTYVVGPEDGTAPSISISWAGTGSWWYNNPAAYPAVVCSIAEEGEATGENTGENTEETEICSSPEITENLAPSESEARALALEIFEATGLDVSASDIRVTADEWQTTATGSLVVDGVQTALDWSVAWSPLGTISYAYGQSIEVVDRGSYDTISAADAVERLSDWRWYGGAGPEYQGGAMMYAADSSRSVQSTVEEDAPAEEPTDGPTSEPSSEPGTGGGTDPGTEPGTDPEPAPTVLPTEEPVVEPIPEPIPEPTPEVVVVTVEKAEKTLLLMWDSEGNGWLVPGFAMPHPEGWWNTVVSLIDGVIELPEPILIEPYTEGGVVID